MKKQDGGVAAHAEAIRNAKGLTGVALGRAMFNDPKLRKAIGQADARGSFDDLAGEG